MQPVGVIFNIQRFSVHDGPGIRTTVFLKGCPLQCTWCHNPEGIEPEPCERNGEWFGNTWKPCDLMREIEKDRVFYDQSGGGVSFSGGEPLAQPGFLVEMIDRCRLKRIHTAIDTSGLADPAIFSSLAGKADLFLYDLKLADPVQHRLHTGSGNILILRNLRFLVESGQPLLIRVPLVPGITATEENLLGIIGVVKNLPGKIPVELLPFHRMAPAKYKRLGYRYILDPDLVITSEEYDAIKDLFLRNDIVVQSP